MSEEIWKPIAGFENSYEISNYGNVRSIDRYCIQKDNRGEKYNHIYKGKVLKQFINKNGYFQVQLSYQYKSIPKRVHRLMAEAFIPNPNNYPCVNHIDGNKLNNKLENLEWCTHKHNNREARRLGLNKGYKGLTWKKRCQLAVEYIEDKLKIYPEGLVTKHLGQEFLKDISDLLKGDKE